MFEWLKLNANHLESLLKHRHRSSQTCFNDFSPSSDWCLFTDVNFSKRWWCSNQFKFPLTQLMFCVVTFPANTTTHTISEWSDMFSHQSSEADKSNHYWVTSLDDKVELIARSIRAIRVKHLILWQCNLNLHSTWEIHSIQFSNYFQSRVRDSDKSRPSGKIHNLNSKTG